MDGTTFLRTDIESARQRLAHAINVLNLRLPGDIRRDRLLDIGCGTGNTVMAAAHHGFTQAVGVDINLREHCWFEPSEFPSICRGFGIDPRELRLVEADLFQIDLPPADVVTMIDSVEHVPQPDRFIARAAELVAPNGCLIIDTSPLYYSPQGHHLFDYVPADAPWQHLRRDFEPGQFDDWAQATLKDLNRVTHDDIETAVRETGLIIEQVHRDLPSDTLQAAFERMRPELDLTGIEERWLFEGWIMLVARRSTP